ncbi:hypothetical protein [Streptomyces sparsogenes]|uniref:hypothetical protein n=1 Tax=Streptomyces sparsogenes TaxID=67365 RepID=UPI003401EEDD
MTAQFDAADIAAMRAEGSLDEFLRLLVGKTPPKPKPPTAQDEAPAYHIARPGAWPCGTAASGPTPGPCCPNCERKGPEQS